MTSFADIILLVAQKLNQSKSIFYLNIVIYQKRKDFTGLSFSWLTFQIFSLASCLAIVQVLH